ncbi:hypothetical protein AYI69_g7057 [Smittium culicis]|uniref:Uncharacterized protein n=1 Tax=Smittium culicis TaxID=133412 RepID=A0A1R1XUS0_9FUNG|nr:hypothetical protein AYI69_g7057 [Smittium culicis]
MSFNNLVIEILYALFVLQVVGRLISAPYNIFAGLIPVDLLFILLIDNKAFHKKQSQYLGMSSHIFASDFLSVLFKRST